LATLVALDLLPTLGQLVAQQGKLLAQGFELLVAGAAGR
jgi:hypothetical protein